jgi:DNA-binding HxlR family transcriptional regulator
MPKRYTPTSAAADVEAALRLLEGRWKLVILFHLFGGKVMRFSDLERAIPNITQKMLGTESLCGRPMPRSHRRLSTV